MISYSPSLTELCFPCDKQGWWSVTRSNHKPATNDLNVQEENLKTILMKELETAFSTSLYNYLQL